MASFEDVYRRLCELYPVEQDRGRKFERIMAGVLRSDAVFAERYSAVMHYSEWEHGGSDIGIDLVAERADGEGFAAFQVKCYDPGRTLYENDLSTFLANTNRRFTERVIISTTPHWSNNLLKLIEDQQPPVQRLYLSDVGTGIDWDACLKGLDEEHPPVAMRRAREAMEHQTAALDDLRTGFAAHDRGKLIMACGTGKTFTALRAAEEHAGIGGRVLFAAPSISLVAQALSEWSRDARVPIRPFVVCSDVSVGKGKDGDSARTYDLPIPPTTDAERLARAAGGADAARMTVVFTTYQSMSVIRDAQAAGMPAFDLAVCDEAHRTTGYALKDEERSNFLLVHDADAIRARKRLYMTATPRIYAPQAKQKASEADAYVASMDDEAAYGPEFHRLGFAKAVEDHLLSDYKVAILVVEENLIAAEFQEELGRDGGLPVNDVGRVIGCLNGLAKRYPEGSHFADDPLPMRRAVAFSTTIKNSKRFVELVELLDDDASRSIRKLMTEARHVDGKMGAMERAQSIGWLDEETPFEQRCHILSNARCLTEGIDVPALDAVLFLQPRKSQIDVVQAVGRVMRRAEGKKYGYVILPVVVPAGADPGAAMGPAYEHVWEVLQALRSHDERFDAWVNKLDLNKDRGAGPVDVIGVGGGRGEEEEGDGVSDVAFQYVLSGLEERIEQWRDAIYAQIIERCGERRYWEQWADSVAEIAQRHHARIANLKNAGGGVAERFAEFTADLRRNLNDSISDDDAVAMLSQHLITKPVFDALFGGSEFTEQNPVSQSMGRMIESLTGSGLEAETAELEGFYVSVRRRAEGIDNAEGRQRVAIELYDNFFRKAYPRDAERLGIVYTPVEIVDFIIRAVADLLRDEFGASLGDEGVHILDPFTGTGTFIVRLLQSGLIDAADLPRKYGAEIHANEILLLAYYIAGVNIETAYQEALQKAGREEKYEPFPGIVLTDTFQSTEPGERAGAAMFPRNSERIERQLALDIQVILGNPPWSVGQRSADDDNPNLGYPGLDSSISDTYIAVASPGLKQGLYDSYVRGIRWASNRILGSAGGGIVAYVTNSGFVDSKAFDGFRKTLASEFHEVHVYNLRGNARTSSEQRRREGGGAFEAGSRAGAAILLLVKRPEAVPSPGATLRYRDIGDYLTRGQKLDRVVEASLSDPGWKTIQPNEHGDWINQRSDRFLKHKPLAEIRGQLQSDRVAIFELASGGVKTNRDAFVFSSSGDALRKRVPEMIKFYNDQVEQVTARREIERDPERFSWDGTLEALAQKGTRLEVQDAGFREAMYRPFFKQRLYLDRHMNNSVYQLPRIFADPKVRIPAIVIESKLRAPGRMLGVMAVDVVPEVASTAGAAGQASIVFPRYIYDRDEDTEQGRLGTADGIAGRVKLDQRFRRENFSEEALGAFRSRYGDSVSGDQIFAYVYGILHSPDYRERYAVDLAKMLPRIPDVASTDDFFAFAEAGQALLDLHIGYEEVEPYSLREEWALGAPEGDERWRVEKMRWAGSRKEPDRSAIVVNEWLTLGGIPEAAHGYVVGPRSALEWLIDRYQVRQAQGERDCQRRERLGLGARAAGLHPAAGEADRDGERGDDADRGRAAGAGGGGGGLSPRSGGEGGDVGGYVDVAVGYLAEVAAGGLAEGHDFHADAAGAYDFDEAAEVAVAGDEDDHVDAVGHGEDVDGEFYVEVGFDAAAGEALEGLGGDAVAVFDEGDDEAFVFGAGLGVVGDGGVGDGADEGAPACEEVGDFAPVEADAGGFGGVEDVGDVDEDGEAGEDFDLGLGGGIAGVAGEQGFGEAGLRFGELGDGLLLFAEDRGLAVEHLEQCRLVDGCRRVFGGAASRPAPGLGLGLGLVPAGGGRGVFGGAAAERALGLGFVPAAGAARGSVVGQLGRRGRLGLGLAPATWGWRAAAGWRARGGRGIGGVVGAAAPQESAHGVLPSGQMMERGRPWPLWGAPPPGEAWGPGAAGAAVSGIVGACSSAPAAALTATLAASEAKASATG